MRIKDHAYFDSIHNWYKGERAFVLATGPGLSHIYGLEKLEGEYTVGINHLILWEDLPFTPTAWAQSELDGFQRIAREVAHLDIPKWYANNAYDADLGDWHWIYQDRKVALNDDQDYKWKASPDAMGLGDDFWRVPCGYSPVTDCAIPILCWMGFTEIYLCGVNNTDNGHVYGGLLTELEGPKHTGRTAKAYRNIVPFLAEHGRTLVNCTPYSAAPVPFKPLKEVL